MGYSSLIISLIGGIGIGSVITTIITTVSRRNERINERIYNEKRSAYVGLLRSLHKAAVEPSDESSKEFALWQTRIDLFGSKSVVKYAQEIVDTIPGSLERNKAFNGLIEAMREDLAACK